MKKKSVSLTYKPKNLIAGWKIEEGLEGMYVAVPDRGYKGNKFTIKYSYPVQNNNDIEFRTIERKVEDWNKADRFRRFPDRWGRGTYTLGYFKVADSL